MNLRCLLIVAVLVFGGREASAQHIYLDTDGDGIHTSSDVLRAIGNTEVSVYLDTSHDADGTPRDCNAHSGAVGTGNLGFFSYDLILRVEPNTGSVRWGEYADANGFTPDLRDRGGSGEILISRRGSSALPPGKYLLGKITVTPTAGVPVLGVATMSKLEPAAFTGFGTPCSGSEYLNSYVLGVDWPAGADGKLATQAVTAATLTVTPPSSRPFNANATISFVLPTAGRVRLAVYDVRGSLAKILLEQPNIPSGVSTVLWDGRTSNGERVASGLYFVRMDSVGRSITRRLILVR